MGLFDKKYCDICGEKIGLLGNRKLEDGNMCKDCAKKLSPFFSDRRSSTVDEIKQQLQYREQNRLALRSFNPDCVLGDDKKFFIDSSKGAFLISRRGQNDWDEENPDIIPISSVVSCNLRIDQDEEEQYYENANGESVSYNPPRYLYSYTFVLEFNVNNPYFDDFEVTLNNSEVEANTQEYMNLQSAAMNIMSRVAPGRFTAPATNNMYQNPAPYSQPINNGYGQPINNGYGQPINNGYGQPMNNGYGQPMNNGYGQPMNNGYGQPMNNGYGQPMNNGYGQPMNNGYGQPVNNGYGQPVNNGYGQPVNNGYGQPVNNGYGQPTQNMQGEWICPSCNQRNTGNFCLNCGTPRNGR